MDWVFSGIGTQFLTLGVTLLIGATGGAAIGYKIGISKNLSSQKQDASDDAKQEQKVVLHSNSGKSYSDLLNVTSDKIAQAQKAGNNAVQTQIGEIHNE